MKSDIFVINDAYRICHKLNDLGLISSDNSGVFASGITWYESEGADIARAGLVVLIVNDGFFKEPVYTFSVNVAVSNKRKILAYFETERYKTEFYKTWPSIEILGEYSDVDELIEAIKDEELVSDTFSASTYKVELYLKSLLFDEALEECDLLIDKSHNDAKRLSAAYLKRAEVNLLLDKPKAFEADLDSAIQVFYAWGVTYATDYALYCEKLLLYFYRSTERSYKADRTEAKIKGRRFYCASDDEDARNKVDADFEKKIKLFFESVNRRRELYRNKSANNSKNYSETHRLIASYIKTSIELFEKQSEKGIAEGFEECLKESYSRLIDYCKIINDTATERLCINKIYEIESGIRDFSYVSNDDVSLDIKCIKAFLGKIVPDSEMFDVFISHKSEDIELAENIYHYLKRKGKEVFLDKITLPSMGNSEYRNSILQAIDNSTHLVVVCSDLEYLRSKWISQEYNIFGDEIREGRKNGNLVLVFTDDVFEEVRRTNKKCLPIQLRSFEIIKYSEFEKNLFKYII